MAASPGKQVLKWLALANPSDVSVSPCLGVSPALWKASPWKPAAAAWSIRREGAGRKSL